MYKWQVKFKKQLEIEVEAPTEHEAMAKAFQIDLSSIPIDWEMEGPIMVADLTPNVVDPTDNLDPELFYRET
jgi:hypothetical protein